MHQSKCQSGSDGPDHLTIESGAIWKREVLQTFQLSLSPPSHAGHLYQHADDLMALDSCRADVLIFKEKGKVVLLGYFNARVGTDSEIDKVIGMFGEETSNNEKLVSFLTEVDLVSCNGHTLVTESEWTCIRPGLKQKSIIDYIIIDVQMLKKLGKLCVDRTDIGISDHFLLWLELRRLTKRHTKGKCVIKKWRLNRFDDKEIVIRY